MTNFELAVGIIAAIVLVILMIKFSAALRKTKRHKEALARRVHELASQFGPDAAQRILNNEIWQGMTRKMLLEAVASRLT
jgi:hypothetical protein